MRSSISLEDHRVDQVCRERKVTRVDVQHLLVSIYALGFWRAERVSGFQQAKYGALAADCDIVDQGAVGSSKKTVNHLTFVI